jgi:peptidoglycan/xylan/chitin deacetylase (PgdA/CDA1 family)
MAKGTTWGAAVVMIRALAHVLSPAGPRARLSIFIFHRVHAQPDLLFPGEPDVARFNAIIGWIRNWFNVVPLDIAARQLYTSQLPARAACITFDDGYADNLNNALPVLLHHDVCATVFVATNFLDGGRMWNDSVIESLRSCRHRVFDGRPLGVGLFSLETLEQRRHAIDCVLLKIKYLTPERRREAVEQLVHWAGVCPGDDVMLRCEQVVALRNAGMQIGAHTATHPILENISNAQARVEIASSKTMLEGLLSQPVTLFAYPNGKPGVDYSARHVAMVRNAGYDAAVCTAPGCATAKTDAFQLPRFTPWDRSRLRFGARLLSNMQ